MRAALLAACAAVVLDVAARAEIDVAQSSLRPGTAPGAAVVTAAGASLLDRPGVPGGAAEKGTQNGDADPDGTHREAGPAGARSEVDPLVPAKPQRGPLAATEDTKPAAEATKPAGMEATEDAKPEATGVAASTDEKKPETSGALASTEEKKPDTSGALASTEEKKPEASVTPASTEEKKPEASGATVAQEKKQEAGEQRSAEDTKPEATEGAKLAPDGAKTDPPAQPETRAETQASALQVEADPFLDDALGELDEDPVLRLQQLAKAHDRHLAELRIAEPRASATSGSGMEVTGESMLEVGEVAPRAAKKRDGQAQALRALWGEHDAPAPAQDACDPAWAEQGVFCDNKGAVTTIEDRGGMWSGKLDAVRDLPKLRTLILPDTSVEGSIEALSANGVLKTLNLKGCEKVTGDLVAALGAACDLNPARPWSVLTAVNLRGTQVSGDVAQLFDRCVSLNEFEVGGAARVAGRVTHEQAKRLDRLTVLDLSRTQARLDLGGLFSTLPDGWRPALDWADGASKIDCSQSSLAAPFLRLVSLDLSGTEMMMDVNTFLAQFQFNKYLAVLRVEETGLYGELTCAAGRYYKPIDWYPQRLCDLRTVQEAKDRLKQAGLDPEQWAPPLGRAPLPCPEHLFLLAAQNNAITKVSAHLPHGLVSLDVSSNPVAGLDSELLKRPQLTLDLREVDHVALKVERSDVVRLTAPSHLCYEPTNPRLQTNPVSFAPEVLCQCQPGYALSGTGGARNPAKDCTLCPEGAVAPSSGAERCTPCGFLHQTDELRRVCHLSWWVWTVAALAAVLVMVGLWRIVGEYALLIRKAEPDSLVQWRTPQADASDGQLPRPQTGTARALPCASWRLSHGRNALEFWGRAPEDVALSAERYLDAAPSRLVGEVLTEERVQALAQKLVEHGLALPAKSISDLRSRTVSGFLRDDKLGAKGFAALADEATGGLGSGRPGATTPYWGPTDTLDTWWRSWMTFMFDTGFLALQAHPPSYRAQLSAEEFEHSVALQCLHLAVFDGCVLDCLHTCCPAWREAKRGVSEDVVGAVQKMVGGYAHCGVLFFQGCTPMLKKGLEQALPDFALFGDACVVAVHRQRAAADETRGFLARHPQQPDTHACVLSAEIDGAQVILGCASAPAIDAVAAALAEFAQGRKLLLGVSGDQGGRAPKGLHSCLGEHWTTFKARTCLQPRFDKQVRSKDLKANAEKACTDHLLVAESSFVARVCRHTAPQQRFVDRPLPTVQCPSDHAILAAEVLL